MKFKIYDEDFTLGNILQQELNRSEEVEGVGIAEMHPLEKAIVIQVFLKKGDIKQIVLQGVENTKQNLKKIREEIQKTLVERG